jgi:hypothetical protein
MKLGTHTKGHVLTVRKMESQGSSLDVREKVDKAIPGKQDITFVTLVTEWLKMCMREFSLLNGMFMTII